MAGENNKDIPKIFKSEAIIKLAPPKIANVKRSLSAKKIES